MAVGAESHQDGVMELREALDYDAPPERVFAMLCDPAWRERVCKESRALRWDVRVEPAGDRATVTVVRVLPARVPDLVKSMVGETIETVQTEQWGAPAADGSRRGDFHVQIKGQPATVTGEVRLERHGGGTRETVLGDVRVKIPFIGKRIEPEIAKAIRAGIGVEHRLGAAYLTT